MSNFKLDNEPKINPGFKIPEHYFDDFSAKVMQKIPHNEPKVISLFNKRKNWFFSVAAILVIALTIPFVSKYNTESTLLDQDSIENYLTYHAEISDDDLVGLLNEADIRKMKSEYPIEDKAIEDLLSANSNLEEYITD